MKNPTSHKNSSILVKQDEKSLVKNLVAMFLKSAWMMSIGSMKTTVYCTNQLHTKLLHSLDENSKCAVNPLKTCVLNVMTTIKLFSTKTFFHRWNSLWAVSQLKLLFPLIKLTCCGFLHTKAAVCRYELLRILDGWSNYKWTI